MKEALKDIQNILKSINLYKGSIDGLIGSQTYLAITELRKYKGQKQPLREIQKILADRRVYFGEIDGIFGNGSISAFNHLIPVPTLTDALLKKIYKNCAVGFAEQINLSAATFHIKTKADLCAFLANIIHESGGFTSLRENMNYSAIRLVEVFKMKYFPSLAYAQQIAKKGPIAIADVVYGGRMGNNRNGDGYDFRGGGLIHLTGRKNYTLASIGIGEGDALVKDPSLITQPKFAVKTALWFWQSNLCSRQANWGNFDKACEIVNGGTNGLKERQNLHVKAWNTLF